MDLHEPAARCTVIVSANMEDGFQIMMKVTDLRAPAWFILFLQCFPPVVLLSFDIQISLSSAPQRRLGVLTFLCLTHAARLPLSSSSVSVSLQKINLHPFPDLRMEIMGLLWITKLLRQDVHCCHCVSICWW